MLQRVAPRSRAKPATVDSAAAAWRKTTGDGPFIAEVVSRSELWALSHTRGGAEDLGDRAVAWIAGRQLGVIATWQLEAIAVGHSTITRRVRRGRLHRLYRGAFLVGHSIEVPGARELAAVLATGEAALVSHRSAASLWGLATPDPTRVHVSVVARHCKPRDGLFVHRLAKLDPRDCAARNGIPTTSPARTLVDLAASATPQELERAAAEARARGLLDDPRLSDALTRAGKRTGVGAVRAILGQTGSPRLTRSEAESRLLGMLRAAQLPKPVTNARVAGLEMDFLWPDARLIVEVDAFAFHGHLRARPAPRHGVARRRLRGRPRDLATARR